ncbi:MAG: beta-propeller domain-containing protein [Desulfitobacteriaceae bacterium]
MKKVYIIGATFLVIGLAIVLAVTLFTPKAIQDLQASQDNPTLAEALPVIGDQKTFMKLLSETKNKGIRDEVLGGTLREGNVNELVQKNAALLESSLPFADAVMDQNAVYSGTNVQVAGVDEADIIKTDGEYIYQIISPGYEGQSQVVISQVYPENKLGVVNRLTFNSQEFYPREIYVDQNYLVVIGLGYESLLNPVQSVNPTPDGSADSIEAKKIMPTGPFRQAVTKVMVYNLQDKTKLTKLRELKLDGSYVSSRKIGSALYLVANKYIDCYRILEQGAEPEKPKYYDSAVINEYVEIDYPDIRYFPGTIEPNYLLIAGLDLSIPVKQMQVCAYLGSGKNVAASTANLYVAIPRYENQSEPIGNNTAKGDAPSQAILPSSVQTNTLVYKFSLKQGETNYLGQGEVPGIILNQFSLDENAGYLRIATTTGNAWDTNKLLRNNIYILDQTLKICGKLEDLAPGEKIYSVRFMGNRGYMVTFQTVDPLFVLDLKDPANPKVLGELKIPGYSNYLHPYDENHLLGFGKDAVETADSNGLNGEVRKTAYYLGMKVALFDVTDVNNPVELYQESIGDRGTESEVLHNHKALLFDREKNLLAFPVSVFEVKESKFDAYGNPVYGQLTFQGAYVYNLNLAAGFTFKGKITHQQPVGNRQRTLSGKYENGENIPVQRILYIGDNLYTVSSGMIKVNDLGSMQEKGSLNIR